MWLPTIGHHAARRRNADPWVAGQGALEVTRVVGVYLAPSGRCLRAGWGGREGQPIPRGDSGAPCRPPSTRSADTRRGARLSVPERSTARPTTCATASSIFPAP